MPRKSSKQPEQTDLTINVDDLRKQAQRSINLGKYPAAIQALEMITTMVPDHSAAWNDLGVAYLLNGQAELSLAAIEKALESDPENPQIIKNKVQAMLQIDARVTDGMNLLVDYLNLRPSDTDGLFLLARVFQSISDRPKATALYKRILQIDPHYKLARTALKELEAQPENSATMSEEQK